MSSLLVVLIAMALALTVTVATAALVLPVWGRITRHIAGLARLHVVVAAMPWVLGGLAALAVLIPGDPHTGEILACHCAELPGWWHLCILHPWSSAGLLAPAAISLVLIAPGMLLRGLRLLREPLGHGGGAEPRLLPLGQPVVLLHGWLRPGLMVDRELWNTMQDGDRAVVVAHERAHLVRRDPAVLMLLRVLALPLPGPLARPFLQSWLDHAERQADQGAATEVGDALLVAEALVRTARGSVGARPLALSWTGASLEDRVQALLVGADTDEDADPVAPDASWVDALLIGMFGLAAATAAPWVHHQLEHLLNLSL